MEEFDDLRHSLCLCDASWGGTNVPYVLIGGTTGLLLICCRKGELEEAVGDWVVLGIGG